MSQFIQKAEMLNDLQRYEAAEEELLRELAVRPDNAAATAFLATVRAQLNRRESALETARSAIGMDPTDDYVYFALAWTHDHFDELDAALSAINEALQLDPNSNKNLSLKSRIETRLNRHEDALATARQSLSLDPFHRLSQLRETWALIMLARFDEAEVAIKRALEVQPETALLHSQMGTVLAQRGELDAAETCFREALRLDPESSHVAVDMVLVGNKIAKKATDDLWDLLWSLEHQKRIEICRRILFLNPRHFTAWCALGETYLTIDGLLIADYCFRRAHELRPCEWTTLALKRATNGREATEAFISYQIAKSLGCNAQFSQMVVGISLILGVPCYGIGCYVFAKKPLSAVEQAGLGLLLWIIVPMLVFVIVRRLNRQIRDLRSKLGDPTENWNSPYIP